MERDQNETLPETGNELVKAIENAQLLLGYICSRGGIADSEKDIVETVVGKKQNPQPGSKEEDAKFWLAYSRLAKLTRPATIESITLARNTTPTDPNSIYRKVVKTYRKYGLWAMCVMLLFQIYWVVGAGLLADVKSLPGRIEELSSQNEERRRVLGSAAGDDLKIQFLEAKIDNLYGDLEISSHALREWNILYSSILWFRGVFQDESASDKALNANASNTAISDTESNDEGVNEENSLQFALKYSSYVLGAIQSYILPLLYGLLGAIAFILRSLVKEIKEQSYTMESRINYLLRVFLGALAGLAIGWFFGDIEGKVATGISSLSPLALAFLAGYSVEVLFSAMDKLIEAITKASPPSTSSSK